MMTMMIFWEGLDFNFFELLLLLSTRRNPQISPCYLLFVKKSLQKNPEKKRRNQMHTARFTLELLLLSPCSCSVLRLHLCSTPPVHCLWFTLFVLSVCGRVCVLPRLPVSSVTWCQVRSLGVLHRVWSRCASSRGGGWCSVEGPW